MRILIIRLSAIGDCVLASPVAAALRQRFPASEITWAVQARAREVVAGNPAVDDLIVWEDRPTRALGLLHALEQTRRRRFDVALDLQGLAKAGAFLASSRAPRRITGSLSKSVARMVANELVTEMQPQPHAVRKYLRRATPLDINPEEVRPAVPVTCAHRDFAADFVRHTLPGDGAPLVGFNIGASKDAKRWPPHRFAQVADEILPEMDAHGIIFGAPSELALAHRMVAASSYPWRLHIAAGRSSLLQMAALAERCVTVVTADTGPMHIVAAMGVPVIALFGPSQPRETGPFGEDHVVVDAVDISTRGGRPMPAARTHYGRRFGRVDNLQSILPAHVIHAAYSLWPTAQLRALDRAAALQLA